MKNKKPVRRRARDKQETREIISESYDDPYDNPNPMRRTIKVNQLPWTDKQKEFFKIALNHETKIMFVNGPAGTAKSLLSVYCGLQLLNMKAISDIMYLRSAVESSESKLGMNWRSKCVILDEAQNSSMKEITTVLTRLGQGSRCFVLADPMQTDLRSRDQIGGFEKLYKKFGDDDSKDMGIHTFEFNTDDIMRSKLCKFIVKKVNTIT
mgnify:CR=1 FL=1